MGPLFLYILVILHANVLAQRLVIETSSLRSLTMLNHTGA